MTIAVDDRRLLLFGRPGWVLPGASIDMFFSQGLTFGGSNSSLLSVTRAQTVTSYASTLDGILVPFAANTLRITNQGLLVEETRTNVVLWNRDLTNAAWTATSVTVAKDQVGADGVANSASSLTATGPNGTVLQSITLVSSARFQSAFVKRITGTGTINMTMDNGVTWTVITLTSSYTQLSIPTQTLANPTVGFRIVTSGDAIAVDFVQNENGTFKTSPIPTTTVTAARNNDTVMAAGQLLTITNATTASIFSQTFKAVQTNADAAIIGTSSRQLISLNSAVGTSLSTYNGSVNLAITIGGSGNFQTGTVKTAVGFDGIGRSIVANNGTLATDTNTSGTPVGSVNIGSYGASPHEIDGYLQRLTVWNVRLSDSTLKALTI